MDDDQTPSHPVKPDAVSTSVDVPRTDQIGRAVV